MTTHHLRLFGIVQLLGPNGEEIRLRTQKQIALLVFLALEARESPTPCPRRSPRSGRTWAGKRFLRQLSVFS